MFLCTVVRIQLGIRQQSHNTISNYDPELVPSCAWLDAEWACSCNTIPRIPASASNRAQISSLCSVFLPSIYDVSGRILCSPTIYIACVNSWWIRRRAYYLFSAFERSKNLIKDCVRRRVSFSRSDVIQELRISEISLTRLWEKALEKTSSFSDEYLVMWEYSNLDRACLRENSRRNSLRDGHPPSR